jgi:MATE family multidrug resistance protein
MSRKGVPAASAASELVALAHLAWPIAIAQLGLIAMSLVDTAILGRVSTADLAGAALGRAIGFAGITVGMGIATGLEPVASQALGAGEPSRAWEGLLTNLRACVVVVVPSVVFAFAVTLALRPLGVEPGVVSRARAYLVGQTPSMALVLLFISAKAFLQAHHSTWPALVGSVVANVVNVPVCALLVMGDGALRLAGLPPVGLRPHGALGAGLALSVASAILLSFLVAPVLARRPRAPRDVRARVPLRKAFDVGVPVGLQMLAEYAVFTAVAMLAGKLGTNVVAAHQIALALASFTYMGALGVGGATAVRVGIAVGAGANARRAGFLGMAVGAGWMAACAALFAFFPRALVSLFTDDPEVLALGTRLLRVAAAFQLFDGIQVVSASALRGAGEVRVAFAATVAAHWLVGFPLALLFGFVLGWGATGLWWGLTCGLVAAAVALAFRFVIVSRGAIARV